MRDLEQPGFGALDFARGRQGLRRLHQRLLHDILALECGPQHAGAVAVQAGSHVGDKSFEGDGVQTSCQHPIPFR